MNRKHLNAFALILAIGVIIRIGYGCYSLGFVHPDEHQQYLEAANRIAYGQGIVYWEYKRGIRHYLYPGFLAGVLKSLDFIGLTDSVRQAQFIRSCMGIAVLGSLALYALRWLRQGKNVAAFALLIMAAFMPYVLFVSARTLSETAIIPLIVLSLYFSESMPKLAGILAGLMFAVRFQSALFVAPFFMVSCLATFFAESRRSHLKRCFDFALGMIVAFCGVGFIDYLTWGSWFHSPVSYFEANILQDVASRFGVSPWHEYVSWVVRTALDTSVLLIPLAIVGALYKPKYALAAIGFFIAHSLVGHKESRFIWPMMPIALILVAEGFHRFSQRLTNYQKYAVAAAGIASLLCAIPTQLHPAEQIMRSTKANSLAIADVGRMADLSGVAVHGGCVYHGNHFYLRKDVPYIIELKWEDIADSDPWLYKEINYLIAKDAPFVRGAEFEFVKEYDEWKIFTVKHKQGELFDVPQQPDHKPLLAMRSEKKAC